MTEQLALRRLEPFASGGNRWCFVHPSDRNVCIKVAHPEVSLADKRRRKGLKGRLKPARAFDENRQEQQTLVALERELGSAFNEHVPRYLGMVATDMGPGIQVQLIRSCDGAIALPLKQYLWLNGRTVELDQALVAFNRFWIEHRIPSRSLLLHNIVVEDRGNALGLKLWVIDGLGNADLLPLARWSRRLARRKAERKVQDLAERIESLLEKRRTGADPGRHGFLPGTRDPDGGTPQREHPPAT